MKEVAVLWKKVTAKEKAPFEKIHEADQARYEKQLAEL